MQPKYKRTLALAPVVALVAVAGAAAMPVLAQNGPDGQNETHLAQAVSTLDTPAASNAAALETARRAETAAETSRSNARIALADKVQAARVAKAATDRKAAGIRGAWAREKVRLKRAKATALALRQRQAKAHTQRVKAQRAQAAARLVLNRKVQAAARRAAAKRAAVQRAAVQRTSSPAPQGSPKAFAQTLVGSGAQYRCLVSLWERESGWNYRADNPSSDAYGIPQALPGSKMASAGSDWATNPQTQIRWGLRYIKDRYGTPCAAWAHSEDVNWY